MDLIRNMAVNKGTNDDRITYEEIIKWQKVYK